MRPYPRVDRALHQLLRGEHRPDGVIAEEHEFPGQTLRALNAQIIEAGTAFTRTYLDSLHTVGAAVQCAAPTRAANLTLEA